MNKLPLFFVAIFFFFLFPLGGDGDFFHHVNTGKYIVDNHTLPQTDKFTFTATGKPWVGYAWGAGILFYLLYSNFGTVAITILVASIAVLTFALLYVWLKIHKLSTFTSIAVLSLAAPVVAIRWPPRPEIFTYPFLISLFLIDHLSKTKPKLALLFPLIILLWVNIYGSSVLFGLIILTLLCIKQLIIDRWKFTRESILFYLSSCTAYPLSLLNGYGLKSVFYILFIPQISHVQSEWGGLLKGLTGPIDYVITFQYWMLLYIVYLLFFCFVAVLSIKKLLAKPFLAFLSLSIFVPFLVFRQLPLAIILSLPFFAFMIEAKTKFKKNLILSLCIGIMACLVSISLWVDQRGFGEDTSTYSYKMIDFIKKHDISGRVFNNQQIGAFLTYNLYPNVSVYIDTRDDLFIETSAIRDFVETFAQKKSVLPLLEKYHVDFVVGDLSDGPSYQSLFYSEDWAIVYMEGYHFIALPHHIAKEKHLTIYDAIDPFTFTGAKKGEEKKALVEYLSITANETSWTNNMRLGLVYFGLGEYDLTIQTIENLKPDNNPKKPLFLSDLDYLLTQSFFAKQDCDNTKKYLDKTSSEGRGKFIFTPEKVIPSPVNKGYTFYYLICENNLAVAGDYLALYLAQNDIDIAEKTATRKQYNQLINNNDVSK